MQLYEGSADKSTTNVLCKRETSLWQSTKGLLPCLLKPNLSVIESPRELCKMQLLVRQVRTELRFCVSDAISSQVMPAADLRNTL